MPVRVVAGWVVDFSRRDGQKEISVSEFMDLPDSLIKAWAHFAPWSYVEPHAVQVSAADVDYSGGWGTGEMTVDEV